MAAHAVGIAAQEFMQAANPMVLWLVPSTPILEQTMNALKSPDHPYCGALAGDFGPNVSVLTKAEALALFAGIEPGGKHLAISAANILLKSGIRELGSHR